MHYFTAARAAAFCSAVAGLLFAAGCGGGADAAAETAASPIPSSVQAGHALEAAQAYTVLPDELVTNGQFTNGLANWVIIDAGLVASQLRSGGSALNVGWKVTQSFAANTISPGKSYKLVVKARNDRTTGSSELAIKFKRAGSSEVIRTFAVTVASNVYQDHTIEFTAPTYAARADFIVQTAGARVIIDSASLKMRSEIPQTETIASTVGSYVPAGYTLAFNDEFNGTSLNRSKWFTRYIYAGGTQDRLNDEKQRYRDNGNHVVANGVLSLVARKVSAADPDGINYESGMIRSDWTARYGYYEARVKMPGGVGVWPAFWLNSDVSAEGRLSWPPEIDIFEFVNNGVDDLVNMLHSNVVTPVGMSWPLTYSDTSFNTTWSNYMAPFNFNEGWHTVGAAWDADTITVYVDGLKIYTRSYKWHYTDGSLAGPAHILLNLAIGGSWAGRYGIDDTAFPQALQIDWVRAYRKN